MADPTALQTAVAAAQVVQLVGMPEARLALAQATIHLATAPKSGAVTAALGAAMADVEAGQGRAGARRTCVTGTTRVPQKLGNAVGYRYPHDHPRRCARPAVRARRTGRESTTYRPTNHGAEREMASRVPKLRRIVRGER